VLPVLLPVRDHLPTRTVPFFNYLLIAANVGVFVLQAMPAEVGRPDVSIETWGLVPARLFAQPLVGIETVFTSMFMHGGLLHLGGNMLFLWIFGDNVEDALGHLRYLVFYLLGGLGAAAAQVLMAPGSTIPMVGASGAIASVLAAYVLLYPGSPITVFNPIPILWLFFGFFVFFPAWLVIGLWFLLNLGDALVGTANAANAARGGVAFMAHVGGFVAGVFLLQLFMAGRPRMDDYARWQQWARRRQRGAW
jgi:membrane associated rhomboid family serine protease